MTIMVMVNILEISFEKNISYIQFISVKFKFDSIVEIHNNYIIFSRGDKDYVIDADTDEVITNYKIVQKMKLEFIETERTDGDKDFTYEGALNRIKELIEEENKQIPNLWRNTDTMSNDDLIEIGFLHFGFNYI